MATVSTDRGGGEVMEGFLCPVCLQDLTSIAQLQVHFEERHASEDSAVLNSIKSIFVKAKRLLNDPDDDDAASSIGGGDSSGKVFSGSKLFSNPFTSSPAGPTQQNYSDPWQWEQQFVRGPQRSHTSTFKNIRSDRIDAYVAETNKLLIRLDKLLTDMPSDPVKRKAHERNLVPWVEDDCVPLCPDCARSFSSLIRRRHHCRLCGAIMCHNCSTFLSMAYANKLVAPVHAATSMAGGDVPSGRRSPSSSRSAGGRSNGGGLMAGLSVPGFTLRRSGSQGSLNSLVSVMDSLTGEQHFRICKHCYQRIRARDRAIELRQSKPLLSLLYSKLMTDRAGLQQLVPRYHTMAQSLWQGETMYTIRDASDLRLKILRLGDSINATAHKIKQLGPVYPASEEPRAEGEVPPQPGPRQAMLQRRIQQGTATFLKSSVLGLDKLPDQAQLEELQSTRREDTARRLATEREAAQQAEVRAEQRLLRRRRENDAASGMRSLRDRFSDSPSSPRNSSSPRHSPSPGHHYRPPHSGAAAPAVVGDEGWKGDSDAHIVTITDDPVVQQMNIIRNYIRQAREASRHDEVSTLERNLKELQEEYRRQLGESS